MLPGLLAHFSHLTFKGFTTLWDPHPKGGNQKLPSRSDTIDSEKMGMHNKDMWNRFWWVPKRLFSCQTHQRPWSYLLYPISLLAMRTVVLVYNGGRRGGRQSGLLQNLPNGSSCFFFCPPIINCQNSAKGILFLKSEWDDVTPLLKILPSLSLTLKSGVLTPSAEQKGILQYGRIYL